ncbi:MAG: 3-isopropylmalate dehydrogenase [Thermodesulfobacteriota bacterium]|nr:3-isopropylmalate dehydrogenase [Thermodesulfobacteriota bacterium]|tara:strand:+ start:1190 stop:2275 length:1086 start_codon:yes stop_codon:yes gene_type:complete
MSKILILPGDGIGIEVTDECIKILNYFKDTFEIEFEKEIFGGASIDKNGQPLTQEVLDKALTSDAVLLGAVGGEKWESIDHNLKPEKGLLMLRKELETFANLRPGKVFSALLSASSLKEEIVNHTDILVIRELTGGIYFGEPRFLKDINNKRVGANTLIYDEEEIVRVARVAFNYARKRKNKVTSLDKANVLEVMQLWRDVVNEVHKAEFSDVELEHLYIDNAAMQVIKRPSTFDVILAGNLFGDIISDEIAELTGSLGMLPSASIGESSAIYEPVHGSAPDIAGKNIANPIAAILSLSMLFKYSLNLDKVSELIDTAVSNTLDSGIRTRDINNNQSEPVNCSEMGDKILANIDEIKSKFI